MSMTFIERPDDIDFDAFVDLYVQTIKGRLRSWDQIAWRLKRFQLYFAGRKVTDITRLDIARYISARLEAGLANGSVNLEISTLSAAFGYASVHWCWDLRNPVTGQHLPQSEGRLRYLSPEEIQALLVAARGPKIAQYLYDFIRLAVNTGCRKNELLKMRWKDVEFGAKRITIQGDNSKNGRRRIVPLCEKARSAVLSRRAFCDEFCADSPWLFWAVVANHVDLVND